MKPLRVVDANTAPQPPLSPARARLRELIDRRAGHDKKIVEHQAAADRLVEFFETRDKAAAEVVMFDRQSADDMLDWSKASLKPKGTAPTVDVDLRFKLLHAMALAKENAEAASRAKDQITASMQAEAQGAQSLEIQIKQTIAEIIAETASGPLLEDLRAAQHTVALKQSRLQQALQTVIGIAHSGDLEAMKPTFNLMEGLAETFRTAAPRAVENGYADRQVWEGFAANLHTDPGAEFEG